jgi:hypothetical protein
VSLRILFAGPLCAAVFALTARGQELPNTTTPVPLQDPLKKQMLRRVSVDKTPPATAEDLLKRLAEDNKLKIEFDPAFLKEYPDVAKRKITVPVVKDIRLDILVDGLVRQAGGVAACVVKDGALVFVKPADAVVTRPNKMPAVQTLLQPPDAAHAAAATALKRKLATKTDIEAISDTTLIEFLSFVAEKSGFAFQLKGDLFKAEGVTNVAEKKVTVKAAKGATLDAILREALKSVDADYTIDGYGNLSVVPKAAGPKK